MAATSIISKKVLDSGKSLKHKITKVKMEGIEIVVKIENITVKNYWFRNPRNIYIGDSTLFSVIFPLPSIESEYYEWSEPLAKKLKKAGYAVKHKGNVATFGVKLFHRKNKKTFILNLLPQMEVEINGKRIKADELKQIPIERETRGTIYGKDGWTLDFYYYKGEYSAFFAPSPVTPFLAQSYIFAIFLLVGLMSIAFLTPSEEPLVDNISAQIKRMAVFEKKEEKKKKKPDIIEEKEEKKKKIFKLKVVQKHRVIRRRLKKIKPSKPIILKTHIKVKVAAPKLKTDEPTVDLSDKGDENSETTPNQGMGQNITPVVVAPPPVVVAAPQPLTVQKPQKVKAAPILKIKPKRLSFPYIEYPESAKSLGIEGKVKMRLYIDEQGRVYKVEIIKGLHPVLDKAAIRGAKKAKYKPAYDQYKNPIKSTAIITITFRLEEE